MKPLALPGEWWWRQGSPVHYFMNGSERATCNGSIVRDGFPIVNPWPKQCCKACRKRFVAALSELRSVQTKMFP